MISRKRQVAPSPRKLLRVVGRVDAEGVGVGGCPCEAPPTPDPSPPLRGGRGAKSFGGTTYRHGFHLRKFAISASPKRWLFSGWNWVPMAVSRATMAVTSPP